MIKEVKTVGEFKEFYQNGKVLVDFWATWCGPCTRLAPELDRLSKEKEDITILKVNVEELPELASEFGVMSIPAMFILDNGKITKSLVGFKSKDSLIEELK